MNYEKIKNILAKLGEESASTVDVLLAINTIVNRSNSEWEGRDLVIRALDKFKLFDSVEQSLLLNMVRAVGLFPYITPHLSSMAISDRLAYEAHRHGVSSPAGSCFQLDHARPKRCTQCFYKRRKKSSN